MEQTVKYTWSISDIPVRLHDIARCMGYEDGALPEPYSEIARNMIQRIGSYCDIRGGYIIKKNINLNDRYLIVDGVRFAVESIVSRQIKGSEHIAFFVCTAGAGITQLSTEYMRHGDYLYGFVVDTLGTIIVEMAMDQMHQSLVQNMKQEGLAVTNRYSPGYCDWDVADQHKLFSMFPDEFCEVTLTDTALMNPVKSVSGITGIGQHVQFTEYTCNYCERTDCIHRNKRFPGNEEMRS